MFKVAPKLIAAILRRFGYGAITMPWGVVWILPERLDDADLRSHEEVHLMQILRDGPWCFTFKYLWWRLTYGYTENPYEVEARKISGHA